MKKKYVIEDAISKKYWYGWYTDMRWTDDILKAKLFYNKQEIEDWIESNSSELNGMFVIVIEVWT